MEKAAKNFTLRRNTKIARGIKNLKVRNVKILREMKCSTRNRNVTVNGDVFIRLLKNEKFTAATQFFSSNQFRVKFLIKKR